MKYVLNTIPNFKFILVLTIKLFYINNPTSIIRETFISPKTLAPKADLKLHIKLTNRLTKLMVSKSLSGRSHSGFHLRRYQPRKQNDDGEVHSKREPIRSGALHILTQLPNRCSFMVWHTAAISPSFVLRTCWAARGKM